VTDKGAHNDRAGSVATVPDLAAHGAHTWKPGASGYRACRSSRLALPISAMSRICALHAFSPSYPAVTRPSSWARPNECLAIAGLTRNP
jgi:hypothetical protein